MMAKIFQSVCIWAKFYPQWGPRVRCSYGLADNYMCTLHPMAWNS